MKQVDFAIACTQTLLEMVMYMELPAGIETKCMSHVLKLLKNLYAQKQDGQVWNEFLTNKLFALGFEQSKMDECVFYHGSVIFIVYVDGGMFLSANSPTL